MDRRLRKSDLLAVIGLLLVLVWTPSYLAADPVERGLADGETFAPNGPRAGDRIVQDVVVTDVEGYRHVLEGACVITFREPTADDPPVPAALVEERVWAPADVRLGPAVYAFGGLVHRTYYDETGTVVWVSLEQPGRDRAPTLATGTRPLIAYGESNRFADHEVRYTSSSVQAGMVGLTSAVKQRIHFALSDDVLPLATSSDAAVAAAYSGNIFVGNGGTDRFAERIDEMLRQTEAGHLTGTDEDSFMWLVHPAWGAAFRDDALRAGGTFWTWFSPEAPIPVGAHASFTNGPLAGAQVDIVPALIERGDGPGLPLASGRPFELQRPQTVADIADPYNAFEDGDASRIRLSELQDDPTPLYRGYTLGTLRALLDDAEPPRSIRSELDAGAKIIGFRWSLGPAQTVEVNTGNALPDILEATPTTTTQWRSNWSFAMAAPGRSPVVVDLVVRERENGDWLLEATDACATGADSCHGGDRPPVDLGRRVVPPSDVFATMRSLHGDLSFGDRPARFLYEPNRAERPGPSTNGFPDVVTRSVLGGQCIGNAWVDGGYLHIEGGLVPAGIACWDDEGTARRQAGSVDLADGRPRDLMIDRREATEPASGPATTATNTGDLRILDVPGAAIATGGILLMLASLAVRIGGWLKVGGHLPVVATLYAKIARSEVLDHARRSEVHEAVRADPGITARELADRTGYAWGVIVHHLTTLQRNGLVTSLAVGNRRSYFLPAETDAATRCVLAAARNPDDQAIMTALRNNPGVTVSELSDLLDRSSPSISRSGRRLVELGVVRKERDGMRVRYFLKETEASPAVS